MITIAWRQRSMTLYEAQVRDREPGAAFDAASTMALRRGQSELARLFGRQTSTYEVRVVSREPGDCRFVVAFRNCTRTEDS